MKFNIATIFLALGLIGCRTVATDTGLKVIGGYQPKSGPAVTATVALLYPYKVEGKEEHAAGCSGVLVDVAREGSPAGKNIVMTAAHCLRNRAPSHIGFGADVFENLTARREVKAIKLFGRGSHDDLLSNFDIAYIEFSGTVPAGYEAVEILSDPARLKQAGKFTLAGYGRSVQTGFFGGGRGPDDRTVGILNALDPGYLGYINNALLRHQMVLCTRDAKIGPWKGDSGGPLFAQFGERWYLAGIAFGFDPLLSGSMAVKQLGHGDKKCGMQPIYTFAGAYKSWLEQSAKIKLPGDPAKFSESEKFGTSPQLSGFAALCSESPNVSDAALQTMLKLVARTHEKRPWLLDGINLFNLDCKALGQALAGITEIELCLSDSCHFLDVHGYDGGAERQRIKDLRPLSTLVELRKLILLQNGVVDLTPLSGLTRLYWLNIADNRLADITPLASLTNLQNLNLTSNFITNLAPLSGLKKLDYLGLSDNAIVNSTPVHSLPKLKKLYLKRNPIPDELLPAGCPIKSRDEWYCSVPITLKAAQVMWNTECAPIKAWHTDRKLNDWNPLLRRCTEAGLKLARFGLLSTSDVLPRLEKEFEELCLEDTRSFGKPTRKCRYLDFLRDDMRRWGVGQ